MEQVRRYQAGGVPMRMGKLGALLATLVIMTLAAWGHAQFRPFAREAPLQTVVSGPFLFTTDLPGEVPSLGAELLALERHITAERQLPRLAVPVRLYCFQTK